MQPTHSKVSATQQRKTRSDSVSPRGKALCDVGWLGTLAAAAALLLLLLLLLPVVKHQPTCTGMQWTTTVPGANAVQPRVVNQALREKIISRSRSEGCTRRHHQMTRTKVSSQSAADHTARSHPAPPSTHRQARHHHGVLLILTIE